MGGIIDDAAGASDAEEASELDLSQDRPSTGDLAFIASAGEVATPAPPSRPSPTIAGGDTCPSTGAPNFLRRFGARRMGGAAEIDGDDAENRSYGQDTTPDDYEPNSFLVPTGATEEDRSMSEVGSSQRTMTPSAGGVMPGPAALRAVVRRGRRAQLLSRQRSPALAAAARMRRPTGSLPDARALGLEDTQAPSRQTPGPRAVPMQQRATFEVSPSPFDRSEDETGSSGTVSEGTLGVGPDASPTPTPPSAPPPSAGLDGGLGRDSDEDYEDGDAWARGDDGRENALPPTQTRPVTLRGGRRAAVGGH